MWHPIIESVNGNAKRILFKDEIIKKSIKRKKTLKQWCSIVYSIVWRAIIGIFAFIGIVDFCFSVIYK